MGGEAPQESRGGLSVELLATAKRLAASRRTRPRQSDLKRAISTAYYALFHALAQNNADRLIGVVANRTGTAWLQAYRALGHGVAFRACANLAALGFPPGLVRVGTAFRTLQEQRHKADYDPTHRVTRKDALAAIATAEDGLATLKAASRKDQTALAAKLLFKSRS